MSFTKQEKTIYDVIIIGGGAAGLFCAAAFDDKINGLILEKTKRPGTKFLLSGGGQCNITHGGSIKDFPARYGKNGGRIRGCLYKYNNLHLMDFLKKNGINTTVREDGKVFPSSMNASHILDLLLSRGRQNGFDLHLESQVTSISKENKSYTVVANATAYVGKQVVIATGGCSYPTTGSDGSMFSLLNRDLAVDVTPMSPALTPINVEHYPYASISGISFAQVGLTLWRDGKKCLDQIGPILFTHENFSGPLMLNSSKEIKKNDKLTFNYLYPCDKLSILEKINHAMKQSNVSLPNLLAKEFNLPKSFLHALIGNTGESVKLLAGRLTEDSFIVKDVVGFNKAMATCGGVSLNQMDLKTMELNAYSGIYIIGEALDIDGETGGYNLQFAYSSARAAVDHLLAK